MARLKKFDNRPPCSKCSKPGLIDEKLGKEPLCEEHKKEALFDYYFPKLQCHDNIRMIFHSRFDGGENVFKDNWPKALPYDANFYYDGPKDGDTFIDENDCSYSEVLAAQGKLPEICSSCEHDDGCDGPIATVRYSDGRITRVTQFHSQDEDGQEDFTFTPEYQSTDAWRGHYDAKSQEYVKVHDDAALSMSGDEENLAKFDKLFKQVLDSQKIEWARVVSRTSNLFCSGVDYYVKKEHLKNFKKLSKIFELMKEELRDEGTFRRTVYSGSSEKTPESDRLMRAIGLLDTGMTPSQAVKAVMATEQHA